MKHNQLITLTAAHFKKTRSKTVLNKFPKRKMINQQPHQAKKVALRSKENQRNKNKIWPNLLKRLMMIMMKKIQYKVLINPKKYSTANTSQEK